MFSTARRAPAQLLERHRHELARRPAVAVKQLQGLPGCNAGLNGSSPTRRTVSMKALGARANVEIDVDDPLDRVGHGLGVDARPEPLAERGCSAASPPSVIW